MLFLFLSFLSISSLIAQASVPPKARFKFVNDGEFNYYSAEYDSKYRVLNLVNSSFQLCFYNTTPNAFTLALGLGRAENSGSILRWVWEANRGQSVRENASLTFGADGNLLLADANGKIAWQTKTANKGVVGQKLLANGNLVLHDSKGKFLWQSFDYPTDTLLAGQSLRAEGATKLVSRVSDKININGAYSLVMEKKWFSIYYRSKNTPSPLIYSKFLDFGPNLYQATFISVPETDENFAYQQSLLFQSDKSIPGSYLVIARPKYNATFSFLRIESDGNVRIYTYYDKVLFDAWEVTFTYFSKASYFDSECQLPDRCGKFGVCEENQCEACPLENGLVGWSKECEPKKITSCGVKDFHYYKVEGVDHFLSKYGRADGVKERDCEENCTKDCKCLGYFYNQDAFKCWVAYELKTLTKVANSTHN